MGQNIGEVGRPHQKDKGDPSFGRFIGVSKPMQALYQQIEKIAPSDIAAFITGESGTGKEICAEALHYYSDRKDKPFIVLNCAGLSETLWESALFGHVKGAFTGADSPRRGAVDMAEGGTLFLDEIGDMPAVIQSKLLRFTQNFTHQKLGCDALHKADIRLISATNIDIHHHIETGLFRADLYYRLAQYPLNMPPLRERHGDIMDLADYYLNLYAQEMGRKDVSFSDCAFDILTAYNWPGNVRELQNIIKQILARHHTPVITAAMIPKGITRQALAQTITPEHKAKNYNFIPLSQPLWQIERQAIEHAIKICDGNIPKAAAVLDIAPSTIYRKIQHWDKT